VCVALFCRYEFITQLVVIYVSQGPGNSQWGYLHNWINTPAYETKCLAGCNQRNLCAGSGSSGGGFDVTEVVASSVRQVAGGSASGMKACWLTCGCTGLATFMTGVEFSVGFDGLRNQGVCTNEQVACILGT
jgi:hypothetical protein